MTADAAAKQTNRCNELNEWMGPGEFTTVGRSPWFYFTRRSEIHSEARAGNGVGVDG